MNFLSSISWSDFLMFSAVIIVIHYAVVFFMFFRETGGIKLGEKLDTNSAGSEDNFQK